jgi:cytidylate kinase
MRPITITIEGRAGGGAPDVGRIVARDLNLDFVDRLLLADIAKRVGATVGALADSERRVPTLGSRLTQGVQRMLHRSAVAGMGGDPYFGPGIETLLARPYRELEEAPATTAEEIDEQHFIATTREVIKDLAEVGNCVILSRGGAAILKGNPNVLRVGVFARDDDRVKRIMRRERLDEAGAREFIKHSDAAQYRYFDRAFKTNPLDPFLYHFVVNSSDVSIEYAAQVVIDAAKIMADRGLKFAEPVKPLDSAASKMD